MSEADSTPHRGHWKHGHSGRGKHTPEYTSWLKMRARCDDPKNNRYVNYGAKGVTVCERWRVFANFLKDMGAKPGPHHTIDRFPNRDGNYEPGNCRWATPSEQANNTKRNRVITFRGVTNNLCYWSRLLGVKRTTIARRLDCGWSIERALTTPA